MSLPSKTLLFVVVTVLVLSGLLVFLDRSWLHADGVAQIWVHCLVVSVAGVGLVFALLTLLLLDKLVLSRLSRLSSGVTSIGRSGDGMARLPATGGDELAHLAGAINEMLASSNQALREEVAERRRAEAALQSAHAETQRLLETMSSILISVDRNGNITQWNPAAENAFNIPAADVVGRAFSTCPATWDWVPVRAAVAACQSTRASQRLDDVRFVRRDGKDAFLGITMSPIADEAGQPVGILIIGADVTERRVLERQLMQAHKLESIGQLAAGIAHEINTPTQFVGDNTRFLQGAFQDVQKLLLRYSELLSATRAAGVAPDRVGEVERALVEADLEYLADEIPKAIAQSLEGIERVARIVRAMKEFSHPGGDELRALDLNKAIESTITVARNEWKYVAEVETDLDPELPLVPCLPGEINQVVLNLIINAAHAITDVVGDGSGGKGTIRVSTRRDGDCAEIRIRDSGTGIPESVRSRVFDPFFTTKPVGKGTGQGLAIAHFVVVEKHRGTIDFETQMGQGTTFIIRLPLEAVEAPSGGGS